MKTSTPPRKVVWTCVVASALGMGIVWPNSAQAQVVDAAPHRIEFQVSPGLAKCNDYNAFYGILLNWVRVRSIDQTAASKLVVDIQRRPDGGKNVKLSLLDASGVEVGSELHRYSPSEECFKVLYWTAWDSAKLLRTTAPPPEEDPPPSIDKLVREAGRGGVSGEKPGDSAPKGPIYDEEFYSEPKAQCLPSAPVKPPHSAKHLTLGFGLTAGLTSVVMPTFRFGLGHSKGPFMGELSVHVMPPILEASVGSGGVIQESARAQGYLGSLAFCLQSSPLVGCVVATGGVAGYVYESPRVDGDRFERPGMGGIFLLGLRSGAEYALNNKWAVRFDFDVAFPIYTADVLRPKTANQELGYWPLVSGFLSAVPKW